MGQSIEITEDGLVCRPDVRLMRVTMGGGLDLDSDQQRALAMLSAAFGKPMSADLMDHFEAASHHWRRGEKALANLRLIFSGLPRLDPNESRRLQLSEYLLDHGVSSLVTCRRGKCDDAKARLSSVVVLGATPREPSRLGE